MYNSTKGVILTPLCVIQLFYYLISTVPQLHQE